MEGGLRLMNHPSQLSTGRVLFTSTSLAGFFFLNWPQGTLGGIPTRRRGSFFLARDPFRTHPPPRFFLLNDFVPPLQFPFPFCISGDGLAFSLFFEDPAFPPLVAVIDFPFHTEAYPLFFLRDSTPPPPRASPMDLFL